MMAVNNRPEDKKQSVPLVIMEQHVGEMNEDETEILVDPKMRTLCQVTVADAKSADVLFEQLMGTGVAPRKSYIQAHSKEATYGI